MNPKLQIYLVNVGPLVKSNCFHPLQVVLVSPPACWVVVARCLAQTDLTGGYSVLLQDLLLSAVL